MLTSIRPSKLNKAQLAEFSKSAIVLSTLLLTSVTFQKAKHLSS